jgi:hypothetical protein
MTTDQIIKAAGGDAPLAKALGVDRSTVSKWRTNGIPLNRVASVSDVTGIPRHVICPKLWDAPQTVQAAP